MVLFEYHSEQEQKVPFRCLACSETNQRENNEDHFLIYHLYPVVSQCSLNILSIADGMGGHDHGEHVSYAALQKVSQVLFEHLCISPAMDAHIQSQTYQGTIALVITALKSALEQADAYIRRMVQNNQWHMAGSTIAVAIILDHHAIIANIGDSPILHYRANTGTILQVTKDHSITSALVRGKQLTPQMARYHERRNELEFYVGVGTLPRDLIEVIELEPEDLLLLCTDGVTNSTGSLLPDQIEMLIGAAKGDLRTLSQQLLLEACRAGETDNQTLILWQHGVCTKTQENAARKQPVPVQTNETIEALDEQHEPVNNVSANSVHQSTQQPVEVNVLDVPLPEIGDIDVDDQKTEQLVIVKAMPPEEDSEPEEHEDTPHQEEEIAQDQEESTKEQEPENNLQAVIEPENTKEEAESAEDKPVEVMGAITKKLVVEQDTKEGE